MACFVQGYGKRKCFILVFFPAKFESPVERGNLGSVMIAVSTVLFLFIFVFDVTLPSLRMDRCVRVEAKGRHRHGLQGAQGHPR